MPHFLIVEDDEFLADAYQAFLKKRHHTFDIAHDGAEALRMIDKRKPEVVILDLVMPNVDGVAFLKTLKKQNLLDDMPVIVASNISDNETMEECKKLGARDFIVKSSSSLNELMERSLALLAPSRTSKRK